MAGKGKGKTKFTPKQQRFIDCFEGDVKKAGDKAGISYPYAKELHTKTYYSHVQEAIREKQARFQEKLGVDQLWLLERYKKLADYSITAFFNDDGNMKPLSEIPEEAIYAVCGLDVNRKTDKLGGKEIVETFIQKFKLSDKKGTLDSIAKLLGLVIDKSEVTLEVKPLVIFDEDEE